ncbi:LamB/YcsF family protein [Cyclobacterium jeungdonense]|uniref:LamB/YcsF family protein n=1 Tax=Cyclobacterium jeungdonense TaxID=708087 RepID=A0ABT8CBU6_9BACT|nr:LamB/YcsF family protein [Cyclobacterium jeungdonense]MDN3690280.1 LamB/YcsF family protein [Cyclobacterium jeungdonense]
MEKTWDINCDLGEGLETDKLIMPHLGSCNIACGGHAGNESSVRDTVKLAKKYEVKVGAHPSYPDRENFGRVPLAIDFDTLQNSLSMQIRIVKRMTDEWKVPLHHIKFHGALYLESLTNGNLAEKLVHFVQREFPGKMIYAPFGSAIAIAAKLRKVPIAYEVFADRRYQSPIQLLSRKDHKAVLKTLSEIEQQVSLFLQAQQVKTIGGECLPVKADTICVHGDHPLAVQIVKLVARKISETKKP